MYHYFVRQKISRVFSELNQGRYELVLGTLATDFEHWFSGQHAMSGRRIRLDITRLWYERLYRLFPNIQFQVKQIPVTGWPWDTLVTVEWTDSYTLLNDQLRDNGGVHLIKLSWGKCTSVRIYCDTLRLVENLTIQANGGIAEALAQPIENK